MNLEKLQKFLNENNLTLEEYMRANMITDEDRKYFDKIWLDAIYKNFGEDTSQTGTRALDVCVLMVYNTLIDKTPNDYQTHQSQRNHKS